MNRLIWVQSYNSTQLIFIRIIKQIEFHSIFRITFNYLDSNVIPFTFHVEDGERRSQSCYNEHNCFRPDLKRNTQGQWCPNITGGFNYSKPVGCNRRKHACPELVSHYPPSVWRLTKFVYGRNFSARVWHIKRYT